MESARKAAFFHGINATPLVTTLATTYFIKSWAGKKRRKSQKVWSWGSWNSGTRHTFRHRMGIYEKKELIKRAEFRLSLSRSMWPVFSFPFYCIVFNLWYCWFGLRNSLNFYPNPLRVEKIAEVCPGKEQPCRKYHFNDSLWTRSVCLKTSQFRSTIFRDVKYWLFYS